jgi:hypothetical protein
MTRKAIIKKRIKSFLLQFLPNHKPDFLIIGAQKSGTSTLHYWLNQHPELHGSKPKEIHYFDKKINYGYSLKWYEDHFKTVNLLKSKLYFESTPGYFYYESIAKQLAGLYPQIKLILVLRDPVERAFSAYNMFEKYFHTKSDVFWKQHSRYPETEDTLYKYLIKGRNSFPGFSEVIALEEKLIQNNESQIPAILRMGIYYDQLINYLKYFGREQILILGFKELIVDAKQALDRVYSFLNVKSYPIEKIDLSARNKGIYRQKLDNVNREYLETFFKSHNNKLFDLVGKELFW